MLRVGNLKSGLVVAVVLAGIVAVPSASADGLGTVFEIVACQGDECVASYFVPEEMGHWENGVFIWELSEPVELRDFQGTYVATLSEGNVQIVPPGSPNRSDPSVNLAFAVQAGPAVTDFTIKSALLTFPAIPFPAGRASAAFTLTDGPDEDGAALTPALPGGAYLAQYNGFVPSGSTFTTLIGAMAADPMGTTSVSAEFPGGGLFSAFPGPASDMSVQVAFSLTPNDLASGTSNFEIVPEPAGMLLLVAGLALVRRR